MVIQGGEVGPAFISIDVRNRGQIPVILTSVGVRYAGSEYLYGAILNPRDALGRSVEMPRRLGGGESVGVGIPIGQILDWHRERRIIGVEVRTAAGDHFRGPMKANLDSLARTSLESTHGGVAQ